MKLGCPLAAAALGGCWVDGSRLIQPHFSVFASFMAYRWSAHVSQPGTPSLWRLEIWKIYDHRLQFDPVADALALGDALTGGDVHLACDDWSAAAERALVSAFWDGQGAPVPSQGLVLGIWGKLTSGFLVLGGQKSSQVSAGFG